MATAPSRQIIHYFAYGSNMHTGRMQERVPSAVPLETAALGGYELRFHKHGADGTGKCNIVPIEDSQVLGVIYRMSSVERPVLDLIEGADYSRIWLQVTALETNRPYRVFAYSAKPSVIDDRLLPESWYHEFVVSGAAMHGLPETYVRKLQAIPSLDTDSRGAAATGSDPRRA